MNSIIDSFPSAKEYLISAALNISVPEDFKRIYNGKTQWGDFVYDREKDEFVKILKCETELPTKLFFLVIRPIAPNGYKTIFPNIDYNCARGFKFSRNDDFVNCPPTHFVLLKNSAIKRGLNILRSAR